MIRYVLSLALSSGALFSGCLGQPPKECSACGDKCVDLQTDSKNCGACGTACPMDQYCKEGVCAAANGCVAPRQVCGATCTDVTIDARNCGACGTLCAGGRACLNRICQ